MTTRTAETSETLRWPFRLRSMDREKPAGECRIVIDEEEIPGLSFLVYQCVATMLHTSAVSAAGGPRQALAVSSADLDAALEADALPASHP